MISISKTMKKFFSIDNNMSFQKKINKFKIAKLKGLSLQIEYDGEALMEYEKVTMKYD